MQRIISFDPGETTGYVIFHYETSPLATRIIEGGTLHSLQSVWNFLCHERLMYDHILFESFHLYAHRAQAQINSSFFTVEVIGVINLYAGLNNLPITAQTAQQGKAIWDDKHLRQFGLYVGNRHTRDALRHVLTYLDVHRHPVIREQWGKQ